MLDRLPPEVILSISSYLTLNDKLKLITTCRQLYNLISKTTLYSELDLLKREEKAQDIIEWFRNNDSYPGTQVKVFSVAIDKLPDHLFFQLSAIFPNITQVITSKQFHSFKDKITFQDRDTKGPMLKWKDTLGRYVSYFDWQFVILSLKATPFSRLTEMRIKSCDLFRDKRGEYLKHAPLLRKFELAECDVDLEFLEVIHSSCPRLERLALYSIELSMNTNDTLPQSIIPANSIVSLQIDYGYIFDRNGLFLDYITRKYRHLEHLQLGFVYEYSSSSFIRCRPGATLSKIKRTDSDIVVRKKQEDMNKFKSLENDLRASLAFYGASGSRLFSNLPRTIKSMETQFGVFNNILELIAKSNINPVRLDFNDYEDPLKDPNQLQFLKDITSLKSMNAVFWFPNQKYSQVFPSASITKLFLSTRHEDFCIDWLLSICPSLEELHISRGRFMTARKDSKGDSSDVKTFKCYPNLWCLKLESCLIDQRFFDFFKATAPSITTLHLDASFASICDNDKYFRFDLSGWNLRVNKISMRMKCYDKAETEDEENHIYIITIQNVTKTIFYNALKRTTKFIKDGERVNVTWIPPTFIIKCGSNNQTINIHGFSVTKVNDEFIISKRY